MAPLPRTLFALLLSCTLFAAAPALAQDQYEHKLVPSDGAEEDVFSESVAVDGDVAVVGAIRDQDNGFRSGSAYVFRHDGNRWVEEQKLLPTDGSAHDLFGISVAVSGNVAVVGAMQNEADGLQSGSAYVFRYDGNGWVEEQKLTPSDNGPRNYFGKAVAVDGDVAVIGAEYDENGARNGSAYVYRWDGNEWAEVQKLLPADGGGGGTFGEAVSLSGAVAVVGASGDDTHSTNSGAVYIFRNDGSAWSQEEKRTLTDGAWGDRFGYAVAVSGDVVLVGMWAQSGSAHVLRWNGSTWTEEQELVASDPVAQYDYGRAVAVSGEVAVVGAPGYDANGYASGSAYVFRYDGSAWVEEQKLTASDGATYDYFGYPVAVSGETAVVGSRLDDDNGTDSGSAYVYALRDVVVAPDAGARWGVCQHYEVRWLAQGLSEGEPVRIALLREDEEVAILAEAAENDGELLWYVPCGTQPGDGYRVRITSTVAGYEITGGAFTITDALPIVTAPGAGEEVETGSLYTIRWESEGVPEDALLDLVLSNGEGVVLTIVQGTANDDGYAWAVPADLEERSDYRIAAQWEDGNGEERYGQSALFQIVDRTTVASEEEGALPQEVVLRAVYPNPLRSHATATFALPEAAEVRLEVFDVLGRRVAVLAEGARPAGWHEAALSTERLRRGRTSSGSWRASGCGRGGSRWCGSQAW